MAIEAKDNKLHEDLTFIIAGSLLAFRNMSALKPMETFIPPSKEVIFNEFQNDYIFHYTVKKTVSIAMIAVEKYMKEAHDGD